MVGVPGRSKGCNTCLQRKVKCDQDKPHCGNCVKSNRLCTGYKRRLAIVLSRDMILDDRNRSDFGDTTIHHNGRWRKANRKPITDARCYSVNNPLKPVDILQLQQLCQRISGLPALRQQFHSLFLTKYLPTEMLNSNCSKCVTNSYFLLQLQAVSIDSPALETSLAAFLTAVIARRNNDADLMYQSRSMYVSGLEQLRKAVDNPRTRLLDETLGACLILSLYELFGCMPDVQNAYLTHRNAAMILLEQRGPSASSSPLGNSLFLGIRAQTIAPSLTYHFDTFLSSPDWVEAPWKALRKTLYDQVMDLFFSIPPILRRFDGIRQAKNSKTRRKELFVIIERYHDILDSLKVCCSSFEQSISGPLYWPELSTIESRADNDAMGKVFPISYHFPSFTVAQFMTMYWTIVMVVHQQLMNVYSTLAISADSTVAECSSSSPLLAATQLSRHLGYHSESRETMARNICQSAEYFKQEKTGDIGSISILTLLYASCGCMQSSAQTWAREFSWILEMIEKLEMEVDFPVNKVMMGS